MFDQFGALGAGNDDLSRHARRIGPWDGVRAFLIFAAGERFVDCAHKGGAALLVGAGNDAIWIKEIRDRGSLAQKFRIGGDVKRALRRTILLHHAVDPRIGVDGNCALFDDDLVIVLGFGER